MKKEEIAKHIFARNPQVNTLHITSDGQAFYEKHLAEGHAGRLKDQKVETVEKDSKSAETDAAADAQAAEEKKAKDAALEKFPFLSGNVKAVSVEVAKVATSEELDGIAAADEIFSTPARKGVLEAIENRRQELTESKTQKPE